MINRLNLHRMIFWKVGEVSLFPESKRLELLRLRY